MSDHVLVLNAPITHDLKTGKYRQHDDDCDCGHCHSLSENDEDDNELTAEAINDLDDDQLVDLITNFDTDELTQFMDALVEDEETDLCTRIFNLMNDESEDSDDMTSNHEYDEHDILPNGQVPNDSDVGELLRNFAEQTGKAKVSSPGGWHSPHSELFGHGVAPPDKPPLTPISPHSERRGRQINYDTYGQPLPSPAMNFDDSPVAVYYRKLRDGR